MSNDGERPGRRTPGNPWQAATDADVEAGEAARALPLSSRELRTALVRPDLLAAHVLGSVDRLSRNLAARETPWLVVAILGIASLLAAIPYGAFSPVGGWWKVVALFTGSLLICFPCLHVFMLFLGFRVPLDRNLSQAMVITATAGLFTFGFFPIVWFITATTDPAAGSAITPRGLSGFLLTVSLMMGVVQLARCLIAGRRDGGGAVPIVVWLPLLLFIVWRMAAVLGLRG